VQRTVTIGQVASLPLQRPEETGASENMVLFLQEEQEFKSSSGLN
jgi:hypothetical protein